MEFSRLSLKGKQETDWKRVIGFCGYLFYTRLILAPYGGFYQTTRSTGGYDLMEAVVMYKYLITIISLTLVLSVQPSHAALELIDDFSTPVVDCGNWGFGSNSQFDIYVDSNRLHFSMDPYTSATAGPSCRAMVQMDMGLARSANSISTSVKMVSITKDANMDYTSFSLEGYFYNTRSDSQRAVVGSHSEAEGDSPVGEIWASVQFGDRGNGGLEAWWSIWETKDTAYVSDELISEGTLIGPGNLETGEEYLISLSYDNSKQFTFSFDDAINVINGPDRGGSLPTFHSIKKIGVRSYMSDAMEAAVGTRTISANIGAVSVNGSTFDDFDPALDNSVWRRGERKASVDTGNDALKIEIHSREASNSGDIQRNEHNQSLPLEFAESKIVEASLKLVSVDPGTQGRTRISGVWYNSDKTNGQYDGRQGNVFAQLVIERKSDETYRAFAYASRVLDKEWTSEEEVFPFHLMEIPNGGLILGKVYDLSLELTATELIFIITDSQTPANTVTLTHTITTPIYPVAPGTAFHQVQTRINPGNLGSMIAEVDDIYSEKVEVGPEDEAANAQLIIGKTGSTSASSEAATAESGEPDHCDGTGGATSSGWFDWTAPNSGDYIFDTNGSTFDTCLSVYSDPPSAAILKSGTILAALDFPNLVKEAGNNDVSAGVAFSSVIFKATKGVTYHIAVDGNNGETGSIILNYRTLEEDEFCFPIKAKSGNAAVVCL